MRRLNGLALVGVIVLALLAGGGPASAHDPDLGGHDHSGPGSTGPDEHSQNMKLLANVARSAVATQSDLAFAGRLAFAGNYLGFRVIDISEPENPAVVADFRCNGAQSDVSVYGNLLFQSVDTPQTNPTCNSSGTAASTPGAWEGIRIFDISNPAAPVHINSVATDCGSHTHTLVPDPANNTVHVYVSSYPLGGAAIGPNCQMPHGIVSIVSVPLANPTGATVTEYHLDPATELANYPLAGGPFVFTACHDISVFVEIKRAAAACLSESQMWDISDPTHPQFLWRFDNPVVNNANIDLWHSSTFSWDGKVVAFGDESGGGGAARCVDPNDQQGRIWFLNAQTGAFLANYKIPRSVSTVCTMHNFNFIPLRDGRKVLVSSAYSGGTTVVDVDKLLAGASTAESEVGYYRPSGAVTWSSYYYNNFIYGNDIFRGVDIMRLADNATAGARRLDMLNPQSQESLIP
ncbi:MAG TPA: hypothetical protein VF462_17410 [Micromonosporaceae bacterium]